ncbi:hypothetical protein OGM63_27370 [Plectonema radiosum NIES-515]|uniref:Uncharacterized protein n=1 Tax=Plectonema radiosum NIES-515 TaxID=2986073 RepID=A0ABT3B8A0_9CYAN|nr:hypothetical protein [Plectonema radiosum NIES-515]
MPLRRSDWRSLLSVIFSGNLPKKWSNPRFLVRGKFTLCDNRGILKHKLGCTHW